SRRSMKGRRPAETWPSVWLTGTAPPRQSGRCSSADNVPEVGRNDLDVRAQHLYQEFLNRLGLQNVACDSCARALMPAPFNLESYSYSARNGRTWTWDVECARGLIASRRPAA